MCICKETPVPKIYVSKHHTIRRREWFMRNKFAPLIDIRKKHDVCHFFSEAANFLGLLNLLLEGEGVRIYLASYSGEGAHSVPSGWGSMMTLIYAAQALDQGTGDYSDTGYYYTLYPGQPHQPISKTLASEWVSNYQNQKLPILSELAGFADKSTDTRSILYIRSQLEEIKAEIECQHASGVNIILTAYTDNEPSGVKPDLYKRLTVQFILTELIHGVHTEFYIEERPCFYERPGRGVPNLDTGSPCPPDSCFEPTLP